MDRIDRLIIKAKPKPNILDKLKQDNPYLGKSCDELLDMMCPETPGGYTAPDKSSREWLKFTYALLHSQSNNGLKE